MKKVYCCDREWLYMPAAVSMELLKCNAPDLKTYKKSTWFGIEEETESDPRILNENNNCKCHKEKKE